MRKSTRKLFKKMSRRKLRFPNLKVCGDKLHVNAISTLPEDKLKRHGLETNF